MIYWRNMLIPFSTRAHMKREGVEDQWMVYISWYVFGIRIARFHIDRPSS